MRLLLLSFYFRPDLCAGSFRASALVDALLEVLPVDAHIDVITTLPNRYSSFTDTALKLESRPRLTLHRIELPAHKSGMLDQSRAFLTYARKCLSLARSEPYDLVFATSSRLMTAALGAWVSKIIKAPLYLDIRDIFVDTIKDVLPARASRVLHPFFSLIERRTIGQAQRVNLVSEGFLPYFQTRYPKHSYSCFTNGIDDAFLERSHDKFGESEHKPSSLIKVLYAGNIGEGQGLHNILPELAKKLEGRAQFIIIGDGGKRKILEAFCAEAGCNNMSILPPVNRSNLIEAYQQADVLFLHLNDYPAFEKVLPSKIFEYAAMGKPIWAGVGGYAAKFINEEIDNAEVFKPCDVNSALISFERLEFKHSPREAFLGKYARKAIMQKMAADILKMIPAMASDHQSEMA